MSVAGEPFDFEAEVASLDGFPDAVFDIEELEKRMWRDRLRLKRIKDTISTRADSAGQGHGAGGEEGEEEREEEAEEEEEEEEDGGNEDHHEGQVDEPDALSGAAYFPGPPGFRSREQKPARPKQTQVGALPALASALPPLPNPICQAGCWGLRPHPFLSGCMRP